MNSIENGQTFLANPVVQRRLPEMTFMVIPPGRRAMLLSPKWREKFATASQKQTGMMMMMMMMMMVVVEVVVVMMMMMMMMMMMTIMMMATTMMMMAVMRTQASYWLP